MLFQLVQINKNSDAFAVSQGKKHDRICTAVHAVQRKITGAQVNGRAAFKIPSDSARLAVMDPMFDTLNTNKQPQILYLWALRLL